MLKDVHDYQSANQNELVRIVTSGKIIQREVRRSKVALDCAQLLKDFKAVEHILSEIKMISFSDLSSSEELHRMASLERTAHATLILTQQLQASSNQVTQTLSHKNQSSSSTLSMDTPLPQDTEWAQFIMKLAPRIRALEKIVNQAIGHHLERVLGKTRMVSSATADATTTRTEGRFNQELACRMEQDLVILGHLFRSFAILDRGTDAEGIFANVAIMPIVRKKVNIGKLDEGGSRGECTGLSCLLKEVVQDVQEVWGDVLIMVEGMFLYENGATENETSDALVQHVEIDLITAGVWLPIATALMSDPAIKMAIFSPGIASIFQQNYTIMDVFLSELASTLLTPISEIKQKDCGDPRNPHDEIMARSVVSVDEDVIALTHLYYQPDIDGRQIQAVQSRIYNHPLTMNYSKKWNVPIYYQLRFGEICARLEKAIKGVQTGGWDTDVYTGSNEAKEVWKDKYAFELPFFMEVLDSLTWMWRADVFLEPLTHRFLRGTIQLLGRVITFIKSGLEGETKFGLVEDYEEEEDKGSSNVTIQGMERNSGGIETTRSRVMDTSYKWCERIADVAAVSWELTALSDYIITDHIPAIVKTVCPSAVSDVDLGARFETSELIGEIMTEASKEISPIVNEIWNEIIVSIMTNKCTAPLSAVKGVAATYRMTNRPPPTQPSPFVNTIIRPLKEFDASFSNRTPSHLGILWKKRIIDTVSERYSKAISELMETVQKTEEALKNRKTRRALAGGMSDGEKVRLQLFLDQRAYTQSVEAIGIDPDAVEGVQILISLTEGAQELYEKTQQ